MSDLKDRLAAAQETTANVHVVQLSELQMLKAKVHQMSLIDLLKSDELHKMKIKEARQGLQNQSLALEAEFQKSLNTSNKFDWNTLSFKDK